MLIKKRLFKKFRRQSKDEVIRFLLLFPLDRITSLNYIDITWKKLRSEISFTTPCNPTIESIYKLINKDTVSEVISINSSEWERLCY